MHDFNYTKDQLYCEETPVTRIVQWTGTPVFIYSKRTLLSHYRKLNKAFSSTSHRICYSVKSNSNIAVCRVLVDEGAGLDVVSGGELYRALRAGVKSKKIVFAGVGKTADEIEYALRQNILFLVVESIPELELINQIAKAVGKKAPVALRVNPEIDIDTHRYISTGKKGTKFGLDIHTARWLYNQHKKFPHTNPIGIQIHIGSQITHPQPFIKAIRKIIPLINEVKGAIPSIKYLDIGGGLGIVYEKEKATTAEEFAQAVLPLLKDLGLTIILQPGRFIAGNAGILVTRVLYMKQAPQKNFVIIDSGMNDFIRPTLYHAYHEILPVVKKESKFILADIVGPVCETSDYFALDRRIKEPAPGDLLAVMGAGAYGFTMSSNYNSRPRAPEVLVNGNKFNVIRRRETYKDLIQFEP